MGISLSIEQEKTDVITKAIKDACTRQHTERKEEIKKLEEQMKDIRLENEKAMGAIQSEMTERTVMPVVKVALAKQDTEESYENELKQHLNDDSRLVTSSVPVYCVTRSLYVQPVWSSV